MKIFSEWRQICRRVFSWRQAGVLLIISIGMTLSTVMFAIGYGYTSQSLPYKDVKRLVFVGFKPSSSNRSVPIPVLVANMQPYREWKERGDLFVDIAAYSSHDTWRLNGASGNIRLRGYKATEDFFDVLGVWFPELEDWKRSAGTSNLPTVVFTHAVGMREFGREAIGRLLREQEGGGIISGGILPPSFAYPHEALNESVSENGIIPVLADEIGPTHSYVIARLAPGITPQIAEQALNAVRDKNTTFEIGVMPIRSAITESSRPIVWGSWALGGMVLLLCCANLSGVLLVRTHYRLHEYALRVTMGAMFFDLVRMLLKELTAISILAAGAAWFAQRMIVSAVGATQIVRRQSSGWEETIFLIVGTIAIAILSALASLVVIGRNYRRGFSSGILAVFYSQRWMRMLLTTGQVAVAMILFSLSYMTLRGYIDIFMRDVGVDTSTRVVSVNHSLAFQGSMSARKSIMDNTLASMRGGDSSVPVAVYVGRLFQNTITGFATNYPPGSPIFNALKPEEMSSIIQAFVSPGFFRTVRSKLLAGREFTDQYRSDEVLINATFAQRMGWSPAQAIGQLLASGMAVIGVVDDFPTESWDEATAMTFYRPLDWFFTMMGKNGGGQITFNYIISSSALSHIGSVERAILNIDPEAVITRNAAWGNLLSESVRGQRFAATSVTLFTIAAIAILVIGISNTVIFIIARRTKDIAISIAVGAEARHVCWYVMGDMVKSGIIGILAGGFASWWVCKTAAGFIYNADRYLNMTGIVLASIAMLLVIALASLLPALRALRIEPFQSLKME